jgi:hypothetical protein
MINQNHNEEPIQGNQQLSEQKIYSIEEEIEELQMADHPIMAEILAEPTGYKLNKIQIRQLVENMTDSERKRIHEVNRARRESTKTLYERVANKGAEAIIAKKQGIDACIEKGVCPNCGGHMLQNMETGELLRIGCKRYDCPVCGKYRAFRLTKALRTYLKKWKMIRMMTLTYRTTIFRDALQCANYSSRIFATYTTNLRRHPQATGYEKGVQYIKFAEFTKNGFIHYHVLVDRYIRWEIAVEAWNKAIHTVMKIPGEYKAMSKKTNHTPEEREENKKHYVGSVNFTSRKQNEIVNIDGTIHYKKAAGYITKYVVKACKEFRAKYGELYQNQARKFKIWTKSARIAIFTHKTTNGVWQFLNLSTFGEGAILNLVTLELSSQEDSRHLAKKNDLI